MTVGRAALAARPALFSQHRRLDFTGALGHVGAQRY
jgi:hypothetical protein